MRRHLAIAQQVRAAYPEVYYVGGIGWCGPDWQKAEALDRVLSTSVPSTCTEPQPGGYFGLAVALARGTWKDPQQDEEYQAYLRGERPDPRD